MSETSSDVSEESRLTILVILPMLILLLLLLLLLLLQLLPIPTIMILIKAGCAREIVLALAKTRLLRRRQNRGGLSLRPVHLLRIILIRVLESSFPGGSL